MKTKLKVKRHGGVALLFSTLVMLGCVQPETLLPPEETHTIDNVDATRFIEIINKQPHQLAAFKEKVKDKHVFYERTRLYTNADYGLTFFIPYGDEGSSTIMGGIYYPIENKTTEGNIVTLKDILRSPHFVDENKINNSIPITKRFLYSHDFADLERQGCICDKSLLQYEFLKDTAISIGEKDLPKTRFPHVGPDEERVELTLSVSARSTRQNGNIIYGLSQPTLLEWLGDVFGNAGIKMYYCDVRLRSYSFEIRIPYSLLSYSEHQTKNFITSVCENLVRKADTKFFHLQIQYTYTIYERRREHGPSPIKHEGGSVDNVTNSSKTGSVVTPKKEKESYTYTEIEENCNEFIDPSIIKYQVSTMVDDLFSAKEQKGSTYRYIPFSEFVDISSKNLNYEYSIAADDLDGEISINPVHTDKNPFNSTTYSGRSTVFSVHSHVNMLPPSPRDLEQICNIAADFQGRPKYKATMVYIPQDSSFYSLVITDRDKAAKLSERLKGEIDNNNSFIEKGIFQDLLIKNKCSYENLNKIDKELIKLALVIKLMDGGISIVRHSRKHGKATQIYDVSPLKTKRGVNIYKPIKCQ